MLKGYVSSDSMALPIIISDFINRRVAENARIDYKAIVYLEPDKIRSRNQKLCLTQKTGKINSSTTAAIFLLIKAGDNAKAHCFRLFLC